MATLSRNMTRQEAEDFLYLEARLLDEDRLEEWLSLFTSDGVYWLPIDEEDDPERQASVIYDDPLQREKRVHQLRQGARYSQLPASRTIHYLSNVEVDSSPDGEVHLRCNALILELRPGDHQAIQKGLGNQRVLAGRCFYRLVPQDGGWRIALKKVLLIDRDMPLYNLTFVL